MRAWKEILFFIGLIGLAVYIAYVGAGCTTVSSISDDTLREHQRRVIELEHTIETLTERLGQYDSLVGEYNRILGDTGRRLEVIRERAGSIDNSIDRIAYLLREYESIVFSLLSEFELLQAAFEQHEVVGNNSVDVIGNPYLD